jgi:hypothetical protein
VRLEGVRGGEPIIDGLRVTVRHVATLYLQSESISEIVKTVPATDFSQPPISPRESELEIGEPAARVFSVWRATRRR